MYNDTAIKWLLTLRLLPFSGRHLGFPVDSILALNAAFHSRSIFRKSHKDTPLHLSRFQRYAEKSRLGGNFTPPLDIGGLNLPSRSRYSFIDPKRMEGSVNQSAGCKQQLPTVAMPAASGT